MRGVLLKRFMTAGMLVSALAVTGCGGGGGNPINAVTSLFEKEEVPLSGTRVSVLSVGSGTGAEVESKEPISLPQPQQNAAWSQPGGVATNAPGHLAYAGGGAQAWKGSAGSGSDSDGRVIALPIVHDGKVFTLDREGVVTAFSMNGGQVWRVDLTPENEKSKGGFGGGMAAEGNQVFVATGYGTLVALNADSGKSNWTQKLNVPVRTSPTVANGKVYVVNTDSEVFAMAAANGQELWRGRGLPEPASVLSNVSPAVSGDTVVVSYASGEIAALNAANGEPRWTDSVSGGPTGSLSTIGDAARPVIDNGVVYAGSRAGRLVATNLKSGERVWSRDLNVAQTPWVAGDAVFVVDTNGRLYALTKKGGKVRWVVTLPDARNWSGPTLAGGKLWLASNKGLLIGVNATNGEIATKREMGDPVYISPVVASGRMFVLTDDADLVAMN